MNQKTPLHENHNNLNAKMCSFAGYDMPIQYDSSVINEHEWVRNNVGIFDVSHMGQIKLIGDNIRDFVSKITPSPFGLTPSFRAKYTVLTNEKGGIIDDLIITCIDDNEFFAVINAARKEEDIKWIKQNLPSDIKLERLDDRALIAVQGPKAEEVLSKIIKDTDLSELTYMTLANAKLYNGAEIYISRLGYTGEDGFEISIQEANAPVLWNKLLEDETVKPIGLAARDSLRLEMGYPLYGDDLNENITPIEADLSWVVSKKSDSYIGADKIIPQIQNGPEQKRIGIELIDKGVARKGTKIILENGEEIGQITSGGFSPTLKKSIAMGYIKTNQIESDKEVFLDVRGRKIKAKIKNLPFVQPQTKSMKK